MNTDLSQLPTSIDTVNVNEDTHHHEAWTTGLVVSLRTTAVYGAIGAFCHVWQVGPRFEPSSLLSWAWIGAWPLGLLLWAGKWIAMVAAGIVLLIVVVALLWGIWWLIEQLRIRADVNRRVKASEAARAAHEAELRARAS